ncbi:hypothetical protein EAF04_010632 [Stromatinia cepivora]|nr:hypothetical protein EAF04_010632 [Stromatinia cepivora]
MHAVHPVGLIFYDGPEDEARKLTAPLWDPGPVMSTVSMKPYADVTKPSEMVDGPPTHQNYSTTNALMPHPLDVGVMERLVREFDDFLNKYGDAVAPSRIVLEMRSYKVSASISPPATALAARGKAAAVVMEAQYDSSQASHAIMRQEVKSMMGKVKESVKVRGSGGNLANVNLADGTERVQEIFGENFARLREIKRKYDPGFIFNKWYPIPPADI